MSNYTIPATSPDDRPCCNDADGYCPQCCQPLTEDQWAERQRVTITNALAEALQRLLDNEGSRDQCEGWDECQFLYIDELVKGSPESDAGYTGGPCEYCQARAALKAWETEPKQND